MTGKSMIELLKIQKERDRKEAIACAEHERRELSIQLNICPECGSPIISQNKEIFDKPETFFFGLIKITHKVWNKRKICSVNKKHYEYKYNNQPEDYGW